MERCVILSAVPLGAWAKELLSADDYVIACDAGYQNAKQLGIVPQLILGDFDSAPQPKEPGAIVLPTEKDDTDTHYAARIAVEKGFHQVLMLGALGGSRIEHTLANLATGLWLAKQGIQVEIADEHSRISYVLPGQPVRLSHRPSQYFSVFPMEGRAKGVCEQGAKYEIQDVELTAEYPVGVSNETLPDETVISVQEGSLLLICTQKDLQKQAGLQEDTF